MSGRIGRFILTQALNFALAREDEAREFYLAASERVGPGPARDLLLLLAEEERGHAARIRALLDNLSPGAPIQDATAADPGPPVRLGPEMTVAEVLAVALERERRSVRLYTLLYRRTPVAVAREAFAALISEERLHVNRLAGLTPPKDEQGGS